MDFNALNAALLTRAEALLFHWFPAGKLKGDEFQVGDLEGNPGRSLSVNLKTGLWADFASDVKGGDLVSLYAARNDLSQIQAANELAADLGLPADRSAVVAVPRPAVAPLVKPNGHGAGFDGLHAIHGLPEALYPYKDEAGELLFFVARYELATGEKSFCPWRWDGAKWIAKAPPAPRPLFGLELLAAHPKARVLVVEGEKCALAARRVLKPDSTIALSWMGGAQATANTDWTPLEGRQVTVWPDADEPGWAAASRIAQTLVKVGVAALSVIDTHGQPEGHDIADAIQSGMDARALAEFARAHRKPVALPQANPHAGQRLTEIASPDDPEEAVTHDTAEWERYGLVLNKGVPWISMDNIVRVLAKHRTLWNALHFDAFRGVVMLQDGETARPWRYEADGLALTLWLQRVLKLQRASNAVVNDAVQSYAHQRQRHPVKEWLENLPARDPKVRCEDLMPRGFGAARTAFTEAVGRAFMISLVARIYQPGCQCDYMPVLEGAQGVGKSSGLHALASPWYAVASESMERKDFLQSLPGRWLIEISELESISRASIERVKSVLTTRTDVYRAAYAHAAEEYPRACVFAGTTNSRLWNHDDSGARRFWPILCGAVEVAWISHHRELLFADALARYRAGEDWWRVPTAIAADEQEARYERDPWEEVLAQWLVGRDKVGMNDVLERLDIPVERRSARESSRVAKILRRLGYELRVAKDSSRKSYRVWVIETPQTSVFRAEDDDCPI